MLCMGPGDMIQCQCKNGAGHTAVPDAVQPPPTSSHMAATATTLLRGATASGMVVI